MKNVSLTVAPYTSYAPIPQAPPPFAALAPTTNKPSHQVTFSAVFDTEEEAISFAYDLLHSIPKSPEIN